MIFFSNEAFDCVGPSPLTSPVILSVPHAGRDYPVDLGQQLRGPLDQLIALEDRHADALIKTAVARGTSGIIARAPRLLIDLNRDERDVDPAMFGGPVPHENRISAKARGGLGLIPRRTATAGDIWRNRLTPAELDHRIASIHRPYHAKLSDMLAQAHAAFGVAILIDIHSMPPLPELNPGDAPDIVIGDLFGRSAHGSFTEIAAASARRQSLRVAINTPYPGNYILNRHSTPTRGIHALQIEVDRRLYLDETLQNLGAGLARMQGVIDVFVEALCAANGHFGYAIAAE